MKRYQIVLMALITLSLNACSQDFKKLSNDEVEQTNVEIAQKFATELLVKLKNGSYYAIEDEATEIFKNQFTEQFQKMFYKQIKEQLGEFEKLEYAETWIQNQNTPFEIYRFKSDFDNSSKKVEIRVVLDEDHKVAGFFIKPWSDMLG